MTRTVQQGPQRPGVTPTLMEGSRPKSALNCCHTPVGNRITALRLPPIDNLQSAIENTSECSLESSSESSPESSLQSSQESSFESLLHRSFHCSFQGSLHRFAHRSSHRSVHRFLHRLLQSSIESLRQSSSESSTQSSFQGSFHGFVESSSKGLPPGDPYMRFPGLAPCLNQLIIRELCLNRDSRYSLGSFRALRSAFTVQFRRSKFWFLVSDF
jgi:hypothetical protein